MPVSSSQHQLSLIGKPSTMSLSCHHSVSSACISRRVSGLGGRYQGWGSSISQSSLPYVILHIKRADAKGGVQQSRSRPKRRCSLSQEGPPTCNTVVAVSQENAVAGVTRSEEGNDGLRRGLLGLGKGRQSRRQVLSWLLGGAVAEWSRLQWTRPANAATWGLPWSAPAAQTAPSTGTCATCKIQGEDGCSQIYECTSGLVLYSGLRKRSG